MHPSWKLMLFPFIIFTKYKTPKKLWELPNTHANTVSCVSSSPLSVLCTYPLPGRPSAEGIYPYELGPAPKQARFLALLLTSQLCLIPQGSFRGSDHQIRFWLLRVMMWSCLVTGIPRMTCSHLCLNGQNSSSTLILITTRQRWTMSTSTGTASSSWMKRCTFTSTERHFWTMAWDVGTCPSRSAMWWWPIVACTSVLSQHWATRIYLHLSISLVSYVIYKCLRLL